MKHVCEKCGSPLDKHTGLCPNCDGDTFVPMEDNSEVNDEQVTKRGIIAIFVAIIAILIVVSVVIIAATNGWIGGKEKHSAARGNYEAYFNEQLYTKFGMLDIEHPGVTGKGIFFGDMYDLNKDKSEELVVAHSERSGDSIEYKISLYEYNPNAVMQGGALNETNHGVELNSTVLAFSESDFEQLASSHNNNKFEFYLVKNKDKDYIFAERIYEGRSLNYECHVFTLITGSFVEASNLYIMKNEKGETAVLSTKFPSTLNSQEEYKTKKLKGLDEIPENAGVIYFEGQKKKFDGNYKSINEAVDAFFKTYIEKKKDSVLTDDGFNLSEVDKEDMIFDYSYSAKTDSNTGQSEDVYEVHDYTNVVSMLNTANKKAYEALIKKNDDAMKKAKETDSDVAFGDVVKKDGSIYYWRYNDDTYTNYSSESGSYRYDSDADNELVKRDKNGKETVILETAGVGKLAIAEDRIFYQKANGNSHSYNVDSCTIDGNDVTYHATGVIAGVVQNGAYVIYLSSDDEEDNFSTIDAIKTESLEKVTTAYNARFITCDNERIYFQSEQAEYTESHHGKTTLSSVFANGSGSRNLFVTDADMYDDYSSYELSVSLINDAYIQNGYIYYVYGSYSKDGGEFKGGNIAKVKLDGSSGEIIGTSQNDTFTIDSKGSVVNKDDGSSMNGYTIKNGCVYKYNPVNTSLEEIVNKDDYSSITSYSLVDKPGEDQKGDLVQLDSINKVEDKLYFRIKIGEKYSYDESGNSYRFKGSALFEKDVKTGKVSELYSVLATDNNSSYEYYEED